MMVDGARSLLRRWFLDVQPGEPGARAMVGALHGLARRDQWAEAELDAWLQPRLARARKLATVAGVLVSAALVIVAAVIAQAL